jgi:hypothetical protein
MSEPTIVINDQILTLGQAMAVRVAIVNFHDALGEDEHGEKMSAAYRERLSEVLKIISC